MTEKQIFKNRKKELLGSPKPFSTLNAWISQERETFSINNNRVYCREFNSCIDSDISKEDGKILDLELYYAIIYVIEKNFKSVLWSLYFNDKTLNIPYSNPDLDVFSDGGKVYVNEWNGKLNYKSLENFRKILDIFCLTYSTSKRINTTDLPVIDIVLNFNVEKALLNIKDITIPLTQ